MCKLNPGDCNRDWQDLPSTVPVPSLLLLARGHMPEKRVPDF